MINCERDVSDMIDSFDGKKEDDEYDDIVGYKKFYGNLYSLLDNEEVETKKMVINLKKELAMAETNLESIVVREVGAMKAVSKPMAELGDEIEEYTSDRSTKKYQEYPG